MRYLTAFVLALAMANPVIAEQAHTASKTGAAKSNAAFLRDLTKRIEGAGYSKVQMIPQMFVVLAARSDGKPITLIVDSNTLKATEVEGAQEFIKEATGVDPAK